MLTPAFELSQDDDFVVVLIKTPYVKISDVDFFIDGHEFKFHVKPYFLRLNLPNKVVEDGREEASYDIEKGTFTIKLPKLQKGEHFGGLDMLTTLLAPTKNNNNSKPVIEVLNEDSLLAESEVQYDCTDDEMAEFNWEIEQELPEDEISLTAKEDSGKYGFANQKAGIFSKRQEELYEIADVPDPESTTLRERRLARLAAEDVKFDPDHYLADFFDQETIQPLLDYRPPWDKEYQKNQDGGETDVFSEEEKDKLRHLPNKEYLLDDQEELSLLLGLVDIVFAYAYNHRTTEGENTVESAWTINKLSSTLCYFETFTNINDVIMACFRRCLSYPLYRHWGLVQCVLEDTKKIFLLGRKRLVKCLLEIHGLFNDDDPRFLLNDLYITDYCVWLQKTSGKKLRSLAKTVEKININKEDVGWQLVELEKAGELITEEENGSERSDDSESTDSDIEDDSSNSDEQSDEENSKKPSTGLKENNGKGRKISDIDEKGGEIVNEKEKSEDEIAGCATKASSSWNSGEQNNENCQVPNSDLDRKDKKNNSKEEVERNELEEQKKLNSCSILSKSVQNEDEELEQKIESLTLCNGSNSIGTNCPKELRSNFSKQNGNDNELAVGIANLSLMSELTSVGKTVDEYIGTSNGLKVNACNKEELQEDEDGEVYIEKLKLPSNVKIDDNNSNSSAKKIVVIHSTTF